MLRYSQSKPAGWDELVANRSATTLHSDWLSLLTTLGAGEPAYLFDEETLNGIAVSSFRIWGFKVGYVGFPAGLTINGAGLTEREFETFHRALGFDLLLIPRTFLAGDLAANGLPYYAEPESIIVDLQAWSADTSPRKRTRTYLRRARAMQTTVRDACPKDSGFVTKIYEETIRHHGGIQRYHGGYFEALIAFTESQHTARTFVIESGGSPQAFISLLIHGPTAVYLHGGFNRATQADRPMDLAFLTAIEWAKEEGAAHFNFQRSPIAQPGLIAYKEKWGEVSTGDHRTYVASRIPGAAGIIARMRRKSPKPKRMGEPVRQTEVRTDDDMVEQVKGVRTLRPGVVQPGDLKIEEKKLGDLA